MKKTLALIFGFNLIHFGLLSCPNVKSSLSLDVSKSNGLWYVTYSTDDVDCSAFETTSSAEPNAFNTIYYPYNLTCLSRFKAPNEITEGFIDDCEWNERFHGTNGQIFLVDYDQYLGYAVCLNEGGKEFLYVTLASRQKTMNPEHFQTLKEFLTSTYGFDISTLKEIKHENC